MFRLDNPPHNALLVEFENRHGECVLVDGDYYLAEDLSRLDARTSARYKPPEHNSAMMFKLRRRYLETKAENAESAVERYRGKLLFNAQNSAVKPTAKQKKILHSLKTAAEAADAALDEFLRPIREKREAEERFNSEVESKRFDAVSAVNRLL